MVSDIALNDDAAISEPEQDLFGVNDLCEAIADRIYESQSPVGTTIALNGVWGSGKSSAANLICYHLRSRNSKQSEHPSKLTIVEFRCWWFKGRESVTLAFLQELSSAIEKTVGEKARALFAAIGKKMLSAGSAIGPAVAIAASSTPETKLVSASTGSLAKGVIDFASQFFSDSDSLEVLVQELSELLRDRSERFLVVVDDIDRLTPDEAIQVFHLVNSVGRLPNVMFLLVFDRQLAEEAVSTLFVSDVSHFLEKIVQVSFDLPLPRRADLNNYARKEIYRRCGEPHDSRSEKYFVNVFADCVVPFLNVPRDVVRLSNAISITWPSVSNEVNLADFVGLETIRIFEHDVYERVRNGKRLICDTKFSSYHEDDTDELGKFLEGIETSSRSRLEKALKRLFPRLTGVQHNDDTLTDWAKERRLCSSKHFETYFRLFPRVDIIPKAEIEEFIARADDRDFVQSSLLSAKSEQIESGLSRLPVLLDELYCRWDEIDPTAYESFFGAILEVVDEIDANEIYDSGLLATGRNLVRVQATIEKIVFSKMSMEERSKTLLSVCMQASLGWLSEFAYDAYDQRRRRATSQPTPEHRCYLLEEDVDTLIDVFLDSVKSASMDGKLIRHQHLLRILRHWALFSKDRESDLNPWIKDQLKDDKSLSYFALAFTHERHETGGAVGELSNHYKEITFHANVQSMREFFEPPEFRRCLENVDLRQSLTEDQARWITRILSCWEQSEI